MGYDKVEYSDFIVFHFYFFSEIDIFQSVISSAW